MNSEDILACMKTQRPKYMIKHSDTVVLRNTSITKKKKKKINEVNVGKSKYESLF